MQQYTVYITINIKEIGVLKVMSDFEKNEMCSANRKRDRLHPCSILFLKGSRTPAPSDIQLTQVSTNTPWKQARQTDCSITNS